MGKTAFVLNIAQYAAFKDNHAVAMFSLEMSKGTARNKTYGIRIYGRFPADAYW